MGVGGEGRGRDVQVSRAVGLFGQSSAVGLALSRFVDRQDQGPVLLTPLYLLLANFLPLWLQPVSLPSGVLLEHYAGLVAVGFGDSAAAVGGLLFGTRKWASVPAKSLQVRAQQEATGEQVESG